MYTVLLIIRFCNKYITRSIYFWFEMMNLETYSYPKGLHLLESWQAGSEEAKAESETQYTHRQTRPNAPTVQWQEAAPLDTTRHH